MLMLRASACRSALKSPNFDVAPMHRWTSGRTLIGTVCIDEANLIERVTPAWLCFFAARGGDEGTTHQGWQPSRGNPHGPPVAYR